VLLYQRATHFCPQKHTTDPLDEKEEKLLKKLQSITDRNVLDEFLVQAMLREQEVSASPVLLVRVLVQSTTVCHWRTVR
jgi:hypothetical protein